MRRSFRGIIVALGLMVASPCLGQERAADQAKPGNTAAAQLDRIANAVENLPKATPPDGGCESGHEDRQSELCAQWKAADAAIEAAQAAWYQFYLGVGGLLVGLATFIAAVAAAIFARKAAIETEKGAQAAIDAVGETKKANQIARDSMKNQLRPYLDIESVKPAKLTESDETVLVTLKNFGQTPAMKVQVASTFRRCAIGAAKIGKINLTQASTCRDIPPNHKQKARLPIDCEDWPGTVKAIANGEIILVIAFRFAYNGLGQRLYPRQSYIIFDKDGARHPVASDNLVID